MSPSVRSIGRVPGLRRFAIRFSKTCCTSERSNGLLPIRPVCARLMGRFPTWVSGTLYPPSAPPTPKGIRPAGRAGGQSKHRQEARPRRARRSALTGLVSMPRARSSRPITSRQGQSPLRYH